MTCCEDARIESKAPISLGKGSLPVRVKALGNSGWRASAKNSAELTRSVSWEKRELRVNPIFFWHGLGHFGSVQKNKHNEINRLRDIFYLNFGGLSKRGACDPRLGLPQ
jgi:hypothetical protein